MLIAALDNVLLWIITFITTLDKREGELIFRYIYSYLECRTPFVRLWISSLTDRACLLYTSPSPRDAHESRMPSSA